MRGRPSHVMVHTSIHEALATAFQEALVCEAPVLSCQDPEGLASRFGVYVGRWDGTGLDGLPAFEEGLRRLLEDEELRVRLGREGRRWVEETHNREAFLEAFFALARRAGVRA